MYVICTSQASCPSKTHKFNLSILSIYYYLQIRALSLHQNKSINQIIHVFVSDKIKITIKTNKIFFPLIVHCLLNE